MFENGSKCPFNQNAGSLLHVSGIITGWKLNRLLRSIYVKQKLVIF